MVDIQDVIIIGSGPAGYTAAIYAARAGLNTTLLAGMMQPGGALTTTSVVENFPGFPGGIMGPELMDKMQQQVEECGATIEFEDAVSFNLTDEKIKKVTTSADETLSCKALILAMGAEHKHLGVPGEERLTGAGVSTCATCDGFFFADEPVVVIGGGDSALEEALYMSNIASSVTLIHRSEKLRASNAMIVKMKATKNIQPMWNTTVKEFNGDTKLSSLTVVTQGVEAEVNTSGAFVAIGHTPRSEVLQGSVELDPEGYVRTFNNSTMTSVYGVFACGDLVDKTYRQAITAAGSGCAAALDAQKFLV